MGATPLLGEYGLRCIDGGAPPYCRCTVVDDILGQEGYSPDLGGVLGMVLVVGTDILLSLLLPCNRWVRMDGVGTGYEGLLLRRARSECLGMGLDRFLGWDLGT